jgi:non-heme chloroperoxidase
MASNVTTATTRTDDGVTLAYKMLGEGPRDLLFLHGWGGSGTGTFWNRMVQHLDLTGLPLILADLRGHGASEEATTGWTTERFAEDMFAIADDAGADQVVLVGYSMSGRWAQWMACTQPDRVISQVLITPVPGADIPLPDDAKAYWLQVARECNMATFEPWVRQFLKEPLPPDITQEYFESVTGTAESSLAETLDMCRQHGQFVDRLQATRAATLVIGGAHDPLLPPPILKEAIVDAIPGARLAVLDCGHETPLEKPEETAALLEAFLAGLR